MGLYQNLLQTKLFTSMAGEFMGEDTLGNKYYQERLLFGKPQRALKRWVMYKEKNVEASNVPAKWFGWLHYTSERPLQDCAHFSWSKEHKHNQTGGNEAYHPKNSLLNQCVDSKPKKPYAAWAPQNKKENK